MEHFDDAGYRYLDLGHATLTGFIAPFNFLLAFVGRGFRGWGPHLCLESARISMNTRLGTRNVLTLKGCQLDCICDHSLYMGVLSLGGSAGH